MFLFDSFPEEPFVLDAKVENSASWNISNLGVCQDSVTLNKHFPSKRGFLDTQICQKCKFQVVCPELEIKMCLVTATEIEPTKT